MTVTKLTIEETVEQMKHAEEQRPKSVDEKAHLMELIKMLQF